MRWTSILCIAEIAEKAKVHSVIPSLSLSLCVCFQSFNTKMGILQSVHVQMHSDAPKHFDHFRLRRRLSQSEEESREFPNGKKRKESIVERSSRNLTKHQTLRLHGTA